MGTFLKIEWTVKSLQDKVRMYIKDCRIEDELHTEENGNSISVVKNSCFSSAFNAKLYGDKIAASEVLFSYRSFSYDISYSNKQSILCRMQFCLTENDDLL